MKAPGQMIREVMGHLFKKPATLKYPYVKFEMPENFRGMIEFDPTRCNACKACVKNCPSDAIQIVKKPDGKCEATFFLDRCIFCAQCVDSCNKSCLKTTKNYELAALDRPSLKITFKAQPENGDKPTQPDPGAAAAKSK
jgi:formate hydrogenlyase subunit 6/NADH:ubiquinone oxidoreductase subunit I